MANITLKGNAITTSGNLPAVGTIAPDVTLTGVDLADVKLGETVCVVVHAPVLSVDPGERMPAGEAPGDPERGVGLAAPGASGDADQKPCHRCDHGQLQRDDGPVDELVLIAPERQEIHRARSQPNWVGRARVTTPSASV